MDIEEKTKKSKSPRNKTETIDEDDYQEPRPMPENYQALSEPVLNFGLKLYNMQNVQILLEKLKDENYAEFITDHQIDEYER